MSTNFFSIIQRRFGDCLSFAENRQIKDRVLNAFQSRKEVQGVSSLVLGLGVGKFFVSSASSPMKAGIAVLSVASGVLFLLADKIRMKATAFFACFTLGLLLGGWRAGDNAKQINELIFERSIMGPSSDQLLINLVLQSQDIKAFDLTQLSKAICQRLADKEKAPVRILSLANCNLTDQQLEEMATAGCFTQVRELDLSSNPQLTGKGIACLVKQDSLEWLTLDGNPEILRQDLEKWAESGDGFKNLKALSLARTEIDESRLQILIAKGSFWINRLKGINLSYNSTLKKLPSTILMLIGLKRHGVSSNSLLDFSGKGFWCLQETGELLEPTKEIIDLAADGKVVGSVKVGVDDEGCPSFLPLTRLPTIIKNSKPLKAIYEDCGLSV